VGARASRASFLAALVCAACTATPGTGTPNASDGGARVLYITHSGGYRHDCLPTSARVLADVGRDAGLWQLEVSDDAAAVLTVERLAALDAVVFFTSGDLGLHAGQKQALLDFVGRGGGFAGFHSATDTEYGWPEYHDLVGATFDGHPWHEDVVVRVDAPTHPAVRALGAELALYEEIYQFRDVRPGSTVLISLDPSSVDVSLGKNNPWGHPLVWARGGDAGRVFYCALGHESSTWEDPRFQAMLADGIGWVLGRR
jgi:type 1 glutamine amidotransferase